MSVSTRLLLIIATCLFPTLVLQVESSWRQWSDRKAQLDALTIQQAQLLGGNVGSIANSAQTLLGAATEFRQVRLQGAGCSDRLARLREHAANFAFLALVDPDGRIRCSSEPGLLELDGGTPWVGAALEARGFAAGRFASSAVIPSGFLPFYMQIPATEPGEGGALAAGLDLGWLEAHLQNLKRSGNSFIENGVLTVADAGGVILARDIRHAEFVGRSFPAAALPLLEASVPGVLRMRSIDGTDRLVGYTPPTAENHRLAAVVGFHEPELMGNLKGTLLRSAMLLALVTVLATVLTLLVARRFITQPTRALLDVARRWSRGELDARAPAWDRGSEFGQMALAYNEMAAALQRREEELRGHAVGLEVAVAERTRALTRANERLQSEMKEHRTTETALLQAQKVQAVGQLAGGIAHDFNNILQAVLGGITLIRRRAGDTEDVTRLAGMIEDSARRGESITRRLLAFSRREELRAEALDLSELLEGLHEVLSATLGSRISVEVEAGEGLRPVFADRGQLETVLVNLATNARDAMPAGGTLTLSAVKEHVDAGQAGMRLATGCYVRLSVTDTGEGMDAETLARAAEPFFTTKPLGRGTGLGLAMARSFAHGSGGEIAIASVAGAGTTVSLWLPLVAKRPSAAEPAAAGDGGALPVGGRAPRILLVDDETMVREVLAAQLEDAGYEVTQGEDGASALRLLETEDRFDLLVTDLAMPGLDGVALVGEARRRQPGLPAILVTGYAGDVAPLASDVSGGFVLLRKPVGGTELAMQVARLLAEAAERQPDAVMDVATG